MTEPLAAAATWQSTPEVRRIHRRTMRVLFAAQILGGIGVGIGVSLGPIIAEQITGSESLAGLARTLSTLGAAVFALPLAILATRRGRCVGLGTGWALTAAGAAMLVVAITGDNVLFLLGGMLLLGAGTATSLQSRYAATDAVAPADRAKSLAFILWASTLGTVLGPNLTGPGAWLAGRMAIPATAGTFVIALAVLVVGAALVLLTLRPDPLLTARQFHPVEPATPASVRTPVRDRLSALTEVVSSRPLARYAFVAIVMAQTVMVAVMTMTPIHMHHEGASLELVGITISAHVLGMFAFSPLIGWLADRWGRVQVIATGQVLFCLAAVSAGIRPSSMAMVTVGLFLLGLAWSCALVAGSAMLTEAVPAEHATSVQGASDTTMNLCAAVAAAVSGPILSMVGFAGLNVLAACLAVPVLLMTRSVLVSNRVKTHQRS